MLSTQKESNLEDQALITELKHKYKNMVDEYKVLEQQFREYKETSRLQAEKRIQTLSDELSSSKQRISELEIRASDISTYATQLSAFKVEVEQREAIERMIYSISPVDGGMLFSDYLVKLGCFNKEGNDLQIKFLKRSIVAIERSFMREEGEVLGLCRWFGWLTSLYDRIIQYYPQNEDRPVLSKNIQEHGLVFPFNNMEDIEERENWPKSSNEVVQFFITLHCHIVNIFTMMTRIIVKAKLY
eukprot:TRINITY_DN6302_c0_g1_i1.p1 TRINITY_DN6302_c0_g1~~TRINITY_DN6302_c0_g1_i1.p1  ORF type:complete len:243 (-),score=26.02 TRINITY_DN6302_c0_g1_i1:583-1311(-)